MALLRSLVVGVPVRVIGVLLSIVLVIVLAYVLGVVGVPTVTAVENSFGEVNDSTTVVETELVVDNPNPIGTAVLDVSANYSVRMNGIRMAKGRKPSIDVPPGRSTVSTRTNLDNDRIPLWWASHVRNDERTRLVVDARIRSGLVGQSVSVPTDRTVETDLISEFNSTEPRPVNASQPFVSDPVVWINETGAQWGAVNRSTTPIDLRFLVYNSKDVPIPITRISYEIAMNDVIVGEGHSDGEHVLAPGEETRVDTKTFIDNDRLDEWWVSHVQNDQVTALRIEFSATIELPGGQQVQVPLRQLTYERTIETDIFGTKAGTSAATGDSDGARATPTATPSPEDSGSATTAIPT